MAVSRTRHVCERLKLRLGRKKNRGEACFNRNGPHISATCWPVSRVTSRSRIFSWAGVANSNCFYFGRRTSFLSDWCFRRRLINSNMPTFNLLPVFHVKGEQNEGQKESIRKSRIEVWNPDFGQAYLNGGVSGIVIQACERKTKLKVLGSYANWKLIRNWGPECSLKIPHVNRPTIRRHRWWTSRSTPGARANWSRLELFLCKTCQPHPSRPVDLSSVKTDNIYRQVEWFGGRIQRPDSSTYRCDSIADPTVVMRVHRWMRDYIGLSTLSVASSRYRLFELTWLVSTPASSDDQPHSESLMIIASHGRRNFTSGRLSWPWST